MSEKILGNQQKKESLDVSALKAYLGTNELLGEVVSIERCDDGDSSNHLNYKVVTVEGKSYIARIEVPGNAVSDSDLRDEFLVLRKVEEYDVAPIAHLLDVKGLPSPVLIEEFISGTPFSRLPESGDVHFDAAIDLITKVSDIRVSKDEFPFKSTLDSYATNFETWQSRLKEIGETSGQGKQIAYETSSITDKSREVLESNDWILKSASVEFIYNDVHKGNIFWVPEEEKAKFIDWQKVSLGDPSFMAALFVRRFSDLWAMETDSFKERVLTAYAGRKQVPNFRQLLTLRMLERSVADMIWVNWVKIRKGEPLIPIGENKYYNESTQLLSQSRYL